MAAQDADRMVKIAVASDPVEADIWRDALEQDGIRPYLKSLDPLTPMGVAPTGSFEIYVLTADEQRARWILGELTRGG
jgi:hypothetical protein